jgi:hypothetical protein
MPALVKQKSIPACFKNFDFTYGKAKILKTFRIAISIKKLIGLTSNVNFLKQTQKVN